MEGMRGREGTGLGKGREENGGSSVKEGKEMRENGMEKEEWEGRGCLRMEGLAKAFTYVNFEIMYRKTY